MATARASWLGIVNDATIRPGLGRRTITKSPGTCSETSAVGLEISVPIGDKACAIKHLRAPLPGARPTRADRIPAPPRPEFEESVR